MDPSKLQQKLIAAARSNPPGDQVPYAFEKRVMARLRQPFVDAWSSWGAALWRSALACVAVTPIVMGWSQVSEQEENLSTAFEKTVLAAADHFDEDVQ